MQPRKRTVEDELSAALTLILRASRPVRLIVAGRTDAGVHARGAVAHVDVDPAAFALLPGRADRTPAQAALSRLNGLLPHDIVVHDVHLEVDRAPRPVDGGEPCRIVAVRIDEDLDVVAASERSAGAPLQQ